MNRRKTTREKVGAGLARRDHRAAGGAQRARDTLVLLELALFDRAGSDGRHGLGQGERRQGEKAEEE